MLRIPQAKKGETVREAQTADARYKTLSNLIRDFFGSVFARKARTSELVVLRPEGKERGCVALSYITWPFREGWHSPRVRGHTNAFEVVAMAEAWRAKGFRVEVCDYDDVSYQPPTDCHVAIDLHSNFERWAPNLSAECLKVLHATGCHWRIHNKAELDRLDALEERRGVRLRTRRQVAANGAAEIANSITVLGNEHTIGTYVFAGKSITRIPISSAYEFAWPDRRDFDKAKRRFLWLGSYGMVHKGLDLVLEAFAGMPELELTVCGRPEKEPDFHAFYERELTQMRNIHLWGWVDLGSAEFGEMAATHGSIIYPSSCEGGGGAVIHGMHAGMLPVCTKEASIDLGDFGVAIAAGTVDAVKCAARAVSEMPARQVEERARSAWEHVRARHTRDIFARTYGSFASAWAERL